MGLLERLRFWKKSDACRFADPESLGWLLVPLGNPSDAYATTRHNLGRLMLQRWMATHCPAPQQRQAFRNGTLYELGTPFLALVPSTYMNLSGQVCADALRMGFPSSRFILLHDDKDLPLGTGRFRLDGSDGGHKGLQSVFEHLGTNAIPRLRLGIGPFQRPLSDFVLGEWTEAEWPHIHALDTPFARFMDLLQQTEDLRVLPQTLNAPVFWDGAVL